MENVNPLPPNYYNFEIKGLSGKDMGIRNNSSLLGKLKQKYSTTQKQTPNPDKVRVQPDTPSGRVLGAVPLNGGCSPPAVTDVIQLEQCSWTRCSFPPKVQWRNLVFLWSPVEKGTTLVSQNLCFHFSKKCWALPPGWSNFQWDEVILSVPQWDSMGHQQKMTLWRKAGL